MKDNYQNVNNLRKQIVDLADIVDIIGRHVTLTKKGNNFVGICPFHDDSNPSMSVSPSKKLYKCFSCGAGGDVVTFISKIENISIGESLKEVGKTVGINVVPTKRDLEFEKNQKYYQIVKDASEFYHFYLRNTEEGLLALSYLKRRNLSLEIIQRFQIGLAGSENLLVQTLSVKNHHPLNINEVDLIHGSNPYFDTFKNRIMFPIRDLDGNYVGFSGRVFLETSTESKYKNTSETIIFKKNAILYNYYEAMQAIKRADLVYLFEGFMDVIAAYRAGIQNTVASMGTSLTIKQIEAIKKITNNVIICYDSDNPGIAATIKALYLLIENGLNVQIATIPNGKDPDEYINSDGSKALYECLTIKIVSGITFLYSQERKNLYLDDINSVELFKHKIFRHLKFFNSHVISEKYLNIMAEELHLSFESLFADFQKSEYSILNLPSKRKNVIELRKEPTIHERAIKRYLAAERKLIKLAFFNKRLCFEIESKLENNFVEKKMRNILSEIWFTYRSLEIITLDYMKDKLVVEEYEILKDIIENEIEPRIQDIDQLIKIVKAWSIQKKINIEMADENKSADKLLDLLNSKKTITKIRRKGREG